MYVLDVHYFTKRKSEKKNYQEEKLYGKLIAVLFLQQELRDL